MKIVNLMRPQQKELTFSFSEYFNRSFIEELYGGDLQAAEEVFSSAYTQIIEETNLAAALFASGDIVNVRKIYHKIKPLFGYVGLTDVQDYVQSFEEACRHSENTDQLRPAYESIHSIVGEAVVRIQQEYERLKDFNKQRA
jgi:HPt (histidine-containing phosphotransfer) domain-containing protein